MDSQATALIIVDMNRAHLDMDLKYLPVNAQDADKIIDKVSRKVIPAFREFGVPIIYVQTMNHLNPSTAEPMSMANPFWRHQMEKTAVTGVGQKRTTTAVPGSPVTEIMPQLAPRSGDLVVVKNRYSPFMNTDLDFIVRTLGLKTFFIVGVNTNNCVLCTAFEAFNRDIRVIVVEDCCASMNGPEFHETAINQIKTSLGWVVSSDSVEGLLSDQIQL